MPRPWETLLKDCDTGLRQALALERVSISKSKARMDIRLSAQRPLSEAERTELSAHLSGAFPGLQVLTHICYPSLRAGALSDMKLLAGLLRGPMQEKSASTVGFIDWSGEDWRFDAGRLVVGVSNPGAHAYLTRHRSDEMMAACIRELLGVSCTVELQVTGEEHRRILEINEAREREAELLREDALTPQKPARKPQNAEALYGRGIADSPVAMDEITEDIGRLTVCGEVVEMEIIDAKNGSSKIVPFLLSDRRGSVSCKLFLSGRGASESPKSIAEQAEALAAALRPGNWVTARGAYRYDNYAHEMVLMVSDLTRAEKPVREDTAPVRRVELHLHTTFSSMDACATPTDLINQAAQWGHPAIAITDHGVVQSFPEAFAAAKKAGIRFIPGCEGYLIDDGADIVRGADDQTIDSSAYVVLDVETTGLNPLSDEIIEIGAVRFENGVETAEFAQLIDPGQALPAKITELTGITDANLRGKPRLSEILPGFAAFCEGAVLVAHNADFDLSFFRRAFRAQGLSFQFVTMDTLALARCLYPHSRNHKLGTLCKLLDVSLENAHRAVHDARATAHVLMKMLSAIRQEGRAVLLRDLNRCFGTDNQKRPYHIVLLAMNQTGMTNLYRLVSEAHIHHFHRTPRIPRSLIEKYREGLILGSACESGELFRAVLRGEDEPVLERIASFYDYLEIQPVGNNQFLVRDGSVRGDDDLRALNLKIVELGQKLSIPVCATGDVHFKDPTDAIFRSILMDFKGFDEADLQPPLYFRTTDDMLREFSYLGREKAMEVVVTNPRAIADRLEPLSVFLPHPEGKETFQPYWPEAEGDLRNLVETRAREIYGEDLPQVVRARIDKELKSIIGYGFSTLYMIAVKLVAKSLSDGYIVGSRGSVGSSLVAFLSGITEVNSLPPHYVCPRCRHYEFDVPKGYQTGLDLPEKACPVCGATLSKDGFNIPFEVFLGFKGDKVPDIDLNFSGDYQPVAHAYIKELFGDAYCFRAGTIGTIAEKTAFGYVLKYAEKRNLALSGAEKARLARGITGVKRTTGQHPAGMVVLPKDYEIYQFTPIQYPADDMSSAYYTTHFDFTSMHDVLVKLDVLGHDDPTMLRKLQDLTGIAPQAVPLGDAKVFGGILSLFSSPEALGLTADELKVSASGTLGIPEFGTSFVRGMLKETRPSTMEELIRISGLSHGTDVWLGNARDLVMQGVPLRECICTRDDIMNQLIEYGVEPSIAFKTMESVRKGRGLKPDMEAAIAAVDAPEWFIDSCKKIKYMFPKAHAVAYVTMALRIAYFKIHYPAAYYCCYLVRKSESFDATRMVTRDVDALLAMLDAIRSADAKDQSAKTEGEATLIEILVEMNLRDIHLLPVDMYRSDATEFRLVTENEILPPITALPGVGAAAAQAFVEARAAGPFLSIDDMESRRVNKTLIDMLRQAGCLDDMPQSSQVSLFESL